VYLDAGVQELRGEVRTVRPDDGVKLWVKDEGTEVGGVPKRLEDGAIELAGQIDLTARAVAEAEPQHEFPDIPRFDESDHRYSRGATGIRASLFRARSQFSSNSDRCACLHSCT
jgi:hypothetical protein